MGDSAFDRIQRAILDQQYFLSEHAYDEMDADSLDVLDVESAILTGVISQTQTDDEGDIRFVIEGTACDLSTPVGVVARFVDQDRVLIITVYEID